MKDSCALLKNKLQRFLYLSWRERWLLLEAFVWLGLMRSAIILLPFRHIVGIFRLNEGKTTSSRGLSNNDQAISISWAIKAAAARTPWESVCLGQALAGMAMLRSRGLSGIIFLGIVRNATGQQTMSAHAWLSSGDIILTGGEGHENYTVISSFFW